MTVLEEVEGFEAGSEWTPEAADASPEPVPVEPSAALKLDAGAVAKALVKVSGAVDGFAGERARATLTMTDTEAALLAPGIVKYLESRPRLAATVAAGGDEYLQALVGTAIYGLRVTSERAAAIRSELEAAERADFDSSGGYYEES